VFQNGEREKQDKTFWEKNKTFMLETRVRTIAGAGDLSCWAPLPEKTKKVFRGVATCFFFFWFFSLPWRECENFNAFGFENIDGFGWWYCQTQDLGKFNQIACTQHYSLDPACDRDLFCKCFLLWRTFCFFENWQCPKPLAGQGWVMAAATDAQKRKSPFTWIGCACRVLVAWSHDSHFVTMFDQRLAIAQP